MYPFLGIISGPMKKIIRTGNIANDSEVFRGDILILDAWPRYLAS